MAGSGLASPPMRSRRSHYAVPLAGVLVSLLVSWNGSLIRSRCGVLFFGCLLCAVSADDAFASSTAVASSATTARDAAFGFLRGQTADVSADMPGRRQLAVALSNKMSFLSQESVLPLQSSDGAGTVKDAVGKHGFVDVLSDSVPEVSSAVDIHMSQAILLALGSALLALLLIAGPMMWAARLRKQRPLICEAGMPFWTPSIPSGGEALVLDDDAGLSMNSVRPRASSDAENSQGDVSVSMEPHASGVRTCREPTVEHASTVGTTFFWIGDDDEEGSGGSPSPRPRHNPNPRTNLYGTLSCQPQPVSRHRSMAPVSHNATERERESSHCPNALSASQSELVSRLCPIAPSAGSATESEPEGELEPTSDAEPSSGCVSITSCFGQSQPNVAAARAIDSNGGCLRPQPPLQPPLVLRMAQPASSKDVFANQRQILMLYASPLCYLDPVRGPTPMPMITFERERRALLRVCADMKVGSNTGVSRRRWSTSASSSKVTQAPTLASGLLTATSLQHALAPGISNHGIPVLHLSAHGVDDRLALENGKGTAHFLTRDMLKEILSLRRGLGPEIVVLNACSSRGMGMCLAEDGGVPHVLCSAAEVCDSWSQVFFASFYSILFQGGSVAAAFEAAKVSLSTNPEAPRGAADHFCLLPEGGSHSAVIFPCRVSEQIYDSDSDRVDAQGPKMPARLAGRRPVSHAAVSCQQTPQFGQAVPTLPEDFLGRTVDVWSVLQHLSNRRMVAVCGGSSTERGIGKSVVLDAVHRFLTLQADSKCVAVRFGPTGDGSTQTKNGSWILQLRDAVQRALHDYRPRRSQRPGRSRASSAGSGVSTGGASDGGDTWTVQPELEALINDLCALSEGRWAGGVRWPAAVIGNDSVFSGELVLLLDGCDELLHQRSFQEVLAAILRRCPGCRLLLSAQRRLHAAAGGQVKVVHHTLEGLKPHDAARLFLRRVQRPITWDELGMKDKSGASDRRVVLAGQSQAEVLQAVAEHAVVAQLKGNPQRIIAVATAVDPSLARLSDVTLRVHDADTAAGAEQQDVAADDG